MTTARETDAAVLALLEAAGLNTYAGHVTDSDTDAKVVSAALPYVVLFGSSGYPINERLGGGAGRAQEFQVTYVGSTMEQAQWAGDKVDVALADKLVTLGGRPRHIRRTDDSTYVRRDDDWTRPDGGPLFFGALRYVVAR